MIHLDALFPRGANDDGQGRLGLWRVVHAQEAVHQGDEKANCLPSVPTGHGYERLAAGEARPHSPLRPE